MEVIMTLMNYQKGKEDLQNWLVSESAFDSRYLGKCESIFCQGNGYLGLRAALEEPYVGGTRGMFVTGTFNKFDAGEVTELPNFPDVTRFIIKINGKPFSMERGAIKEYERTFCLKNGEIVRELVWKSPEGEEIRLRFRRMVSMDNEHVIANTVEITPLNGDVQIEIESGIDGTVTNTGSQHFSEGFRRIYGNRFLEMISETTQSGVMAAIHAAHSIYLDGDLAEPELLPVIDRRIIRIRYKLQLAHRSTLRVEKISTVHTSRDLCYACRKEEEVKEELKKTGKELIFGLHGKTYEELLKDSSRQWEKIWGEQEIRIKSANDFDQLALRFAVYHLNIMVKKDDSRVGIGAKALSGEGYKGHSFWDTEIFLLPYFMLTQPETAKTLLKYRYKNLYGARKKARENGYEGAMYPWEAAWIDDGEVTPLWGAADVVTGETLKILTGLIEQHITADVAYAIWQYYTITHDEAFMEQYGYEILLDTAKFWASRLEWNEERGWYEINNVIGPDEYKEHVNNNAYTNHLAYRNMKLAAEIISALHQDKPALYERLDQQLGLEEWKESLLERMEKLYLPMPQQETGIIPQFDGFFDLKSIDLTKYKQSSVVGTIYNDYNMEQINGFQVLKQGDVVVLLYLLDDLFGDEVKKKNYYYYEERTLHDSSLSRAVHSILANDLGLKREAYDFFQGACRTDLGPEMKSSDAGIHSACVGGIWQAAVMGFGGVRVVGDKLRLQPSLPEEWKELEYKIVWRNSLLAVTVTRDEVQITNSGKEVSVIVGKKELTVKEGAVVIEKLSPDNQ
jgi:trehalose/maltose hydrolase-like predicted phosphorylase